MDGEWSDLPLGEVITLQRGFDLPAQDRKPGKIPIVSSSGISGYHSEIGVKGPGVVTGRYGTIGQLFLLKEDYWPLNTTLWVKDFHGNDPQFTSYLLRTVDFRSCSDKSSVPGVNRNDLHQIPVRIPPLVEQKRIAAVLGALDDKIELNRRMNATLEAMARALFQSWFVDFDPVRAKLDGRQPTGLDPATAALFPNEFEDSDLGPIPKGWSLKRIEEVSERVAMGPFGSSIRVSTFVPEGIPVISGQHLHEMMLDDSAFNFVTPEHADQLKRSNVRRGDVIFTHAGSIGQVSFIPESSEFTRYVISQRQFYMRCDTKQVSPLYITLYFKTPDGQQRLLANTSSTGVPSIAQPVTYLRQLQVIVPPPALLDRFQNIVGAWMRQVAANVHQSRTLAAIRDTLLPKLLNGRLGFSNLIRRSLS
jgi:type I restriction enzyme S subunit